MCDAPPCYNAVVATAQRRQRKSTGAAKDTVDATAAKKKAPAKKAPAKKTPAKRETKAPRKTSRRKEESSDCDCSDCRSDSDISSCDCSDCEPTPRRSRCPPRGRCCGDSCPPKRAPRRPSRRSNDCYSCCSGYRGCC